LTHHRRLETWHQLHDHELGQEPLPLELRRDLIGAIAALPAIYREVLILGDVHELTAPEAAQLPNIPTDAVKSCLHRAREMMREHLLTKGYLAAGDPSGARKSGG
jgi:DNA-directed RNA polymerase specialized sigma24 family protein